VIHMKQKCLELFHPHENIVIDESMISFKGRTQYKMYNPQKPHKWVLRVFSLADYNKLFAYPLNPVPWSLATSDGGFAKTDKAELLHVLECESDARNKYKSPHDLPFNCAVVVDGNAMLQAMTHLPGTFGEFAMSVFKCLPEVQTVHFVLAGVSPCP